MHLLFFFWGTPYKIFGDLINGFSDFAYVFDIVHDMKRYTLQEGFSQHYPSCYAQGFCFPTSKPVPHIIDQELEVPICGSTMEDEVP